MKRFLRDFLEDEDEEHEGSHHLVSWEVVSRPLDLGGLGIGNVRLCNDILLTKA